MLFNDYLHAVTEDGATPMVRIVKIAWTAYIVGKFRPFSPRF